MKGMRLLAVMLASAIGAASAQSPAIETLLSAYSTKRFAETPVDRALVDRIIDCGLKAPSARNGQPWKLTVVYDAKLARKAIPDMDEGNVLIIVSGKGKQEAGADVVFDCALATENMYVAAQALGLGAHLYTGPIARVNGEQRSLLRIPEGYRAIALLRIGNVDSKADALSAASKRKERAELVDDAGK